MLLLAAALAHAEAPAYAGVGLGMGVAGPVLTAAGFVTWAVSMGEKPVEAWGKDDFTPEAAAARRLEHRRRARWSVAGGSAAILGAASTIVGPPLLLAGGLVGSEGRSQAAGWTGVGLYGAALTATGIGIAAQDEDAAPALFVVAGVAYVGSLVAGGVQLAVDGAEGPAWVVPVAAGRF